MERKYYVIKLRTVENKHVTCLSLYLLHMTTLGKVARLMFSVEVTRLVETVELVNCFTVLGFEGQVKLIFRLL